MQLLTNLWGSVSIEIQIEEDEKFYNLLAIRKVDCT